MVREDDLLQYPVGIRHVIVNGEFLIRNGEHNGVAEFGTLGSEPGQFTNLHHIAADSKGNIYTAEVGQNRRVQKFVDATGLD